MSRAIIGHDISDRYLDLIRTFPLRPIRSKGEYRRAAKVLDSLAVRDEGSLPAGERDYFDTLTLLVEDYDRAHALKTDPGADPIKLLQHLMQENGMNVTELGILLGSKSVASEVLNGKRSLSRSNVLKLAERFGLSADAFLTA